MWGFGHHVGGGQPLHPIYRPSAFDADRFAWKRVVVTGPRHLHPEDHAVVQRTITQAVLARPASVVVTDSGATNLQALYATLKLIRAKQAHPLFDVTLVVTYTLASVPEFFALIQASGLPQPGARGFNVLGLGMDPGRGESLEARDLVALGRIGWDCVDSLVLAFTPAGGWQSENRMPSIIRTARSQGMTIIEVPLPNTMGRPAASP